MAHVRVYCGLASTDPPRPLAAGSPALSATVVDDAGRVLDVCDLGDDSYGFAYLSTLLAERASGQYSVAVAADNDQLLVTRLLITAGWAMALVDGRTAHDFSQRFADDLGGDMESAATQRRALGLARGLQAGAVAASLLPPAPELADVKPVLAAHSALAASRHGAAVALREVLRELYPAALRAYPDPADPVALAVMAELPEPGMVARGRDAHAAVDEVRARLGRSGMTDQATVDEAVRALAQAVMETPRRGGLSRSLTPTAAETVRQAVAAVQACDAANTTLVNALAEHAVGTTDGTDHTPQRAAGTHESAPPPGGTAQGSPAPGSPAQGSPAQGSPAQGSPAQGSPAQGSPAQGSPAQEPSGAPAHSRPVSPPPPPPPGITPIGERPTSGASRNGQYPGGDPTPSRAPSSPHGAYPDGTGEYAPQPGPGYAHYAQAGRGAQPDRSPPGYPADGGPPHAAGAGQGGYPPQEQPDEHGRVPTPRPAPDRPPRGSRSEWPTYPPADEWATGPSGEQRAPSGGQGGSDHTGTSWHGSDQWRGNDQQWSPSAEESRLRLVEPTLPEELREDYASGHIPAPGHIPQASGPPPTSGGQAASEHGPPLRLMSPASGGTHGPYGTAPGSPASGSPATGAPTSGPGGDPYGGGTPHSAPPVSAAAEDDDLLIFAQTRSAWFNQTADWESAIDDGWQAAEQAAQPTVGDRTGAGLPRRVPHANLVPGAPPSREERTLRVVRDPATIAAHTSGYFNGWRRGQEVGGFPLGNRPARRAAGAWEFHRDEDRLSG